MNKLSITKRAKILNLLVEGMSMWAVCRWRLRTASNWRRGRFRAKRRGGS